MSARVKPTDKQKAFVKAKLENPGISNYQAAIRAQYSPNTAKNAQKRIVEKDGTIAAMNEWRKKLRERGLGEEKLLDKYEQWIDAKKAVSARITSRDADSTTDDFIDVDDYQTQLKAGEWLREDFGIKQTSTSALNIHGDKVLVIPSELIAKYGLTPDPVDSSPGQS